MKKIIVRINSAGASASFLPTDLYSFKSARDLSLHPSSNQRGTSGALESPNPASASPASSKVDRETVLSNAKKVGSAKMQSSGGAVSQQEVVAALGGLLHRAGIPMTLEKEVSGGGTAEVK